MNRDPMPNPPAIDPRERAVASQHWGEMACYLVHDDGRYYAWINRDDGSPDVVFAMPSLDAARRFLTGWQASNLLHAGGWDDALAHVFINEPDAPGMYYEAAVLDAAGTGIWHVSQDTISGETSSALASCDDLGDALSAFAEGAEQAADRIERGRVGSDPDLLAAVLRYRAAAVRAERARAILGDALRRSEASTAGKRTVARAAGATAEILDRVLEGGGWAWPRGRQVRPPGSRLPGTPVRELAAWTVDGKQFSLVGYTDTQGGACVAVDQDGQAGPALCDVTVSDRHPVGAGASVAAMGRGTAVVYGRVDDDVTGIYAVMKNGERVGWPACYDPENRQRYFAVIADREQLADIVAERPGGNVSLKPLFGIWFRRAP